jgi:surface antigen
MRRACIAAIAVVPMIAGCGPDGPNNADTGLVVGAVTGGIIGNQVGKGSGNVLATMAGVVVGGIVGSEIGRRMDEHDRMYAQQAEYAALEEGESERPRRWRNPDNGRYGEIVPEAYYDRGGSRCRDFVHFVWIEGRKREMRGTACRNPDGTWTQVS